MDALSIIRDLAGGKFLEELAEKLRVTADEVKAAGAAGSVTPKIDVKPFGEPGNPAIVFDVSWDRKPPKRKSPATIFFVNADGDLQRSDPRQIAMTFTAVETEIVTHETAERPTITREA